MNLLLSYFKELFEPTFNDFVVAGKDEHGLDYYKIKGYVGDVEKFLDEAEEAIDKLGIMDAGQYAAELKKYYQENY